MRPLSLFEGYGIEVEAAVVDAESLDPRPVVDELLRRAAGGTEWVEDVDDGAIGWSNELVNHVIELKTNGPSATLAGLAARFDASLRRLDGMLGAGWGARLMPAGMHPWMDPAAETRLWPHAHGPVYSAYDHLFDCRRHGWANLQSVHLNLPFADDHEFGTLLAAVRLVLPLIPALAAASPFVEGRATGALDSRLVHYRTNSARVPSMTGEVIPEPVFEPAAYHERVLAPIDRELEALDADRALLGQEWTNARGAIARFDRLAIEVRLIDAQECAAADLALCAAVAGAVRGLVEERWCTHARQREQGSAPLVALLERTVRDGPRAALGDPGYAELFGTRGRADAGALWEHLVGAGLGVPAELEPALAVVLDQGTLAERILRAAGPAPDRARLHAVYRDLCACLAAGCPFEP